MPTYDDQFGGLHEGGALGKKKATPVTHPTKTSPLPGGGTLSNPPPNPEVPPAAPPPLPPGSLGIPDLPPDIEATVAQILAGDPTNGAARALAYIRGTAWYAQTYAGIGAGIKSGVITDEGSYRSWKSQVIDNFQRYYSRPPTDAEMTTFLGSGYTPGDVAQIGGGHAWAAANAPEANYELGAFGEGPISTSDLETLGQQNVGRTSTAGAAFQTKLQQAAAKMDRIFQGTLAGPNFQLGSGGLSAPSLQTKQKPDVAA